MKIAVNNFGPIYRASINLKPLTIVIGLNNLGKSFIGQLIYSIVCSLNKPPSRVFGGQYPNFGFFDFIKYIMPDNKNLKDQTLNLFKGNVSLDSYTNRFMAYFKVQCSRAMETMLEDALTSTFGVELEELINYRKQTTSFSFTLKSGITFSTTINNKGVLSVKPKFSNTLNAHISRTIQNNYEQYINSDKRQEKFLDSV